MRPTTLSRADSHVMVMRLWRERRELPGRDDAWRLSIELVDGGPRVVLIDATEIARVLTPLADRIGARLPAELRPH